MNGWKLALCGLAAALFAPLASAADPLELRYLVLEKAFRKVRAETTLTLSLYRDAGCTSLYEEIEILAGSLPVTVQLKAVPPKGAPKPLKVAELRFSLLAGNPPPHLFARVAGVGLEVPPGFECQAQPGSANAAWHWITAEDEILATSPSLAGTVVTRLTGEPDGRYCVDFPNDAPIAIRGIVGSLQVTFPGYVIRVNSINNNLCNAGAQGAVMVSVDRLDAGAFIPANGAYTLMVPGPGDVIPDN